MYKVIFSIFITIFYSIFSYGLTEENQKEIFKKDFIYKFDFGKENSTIESSFIPVSPRTIYNSEHGYGWKWTKEYPIGKSIYPENIFPDNLYKDWLEVNNGMFNLDLSNGRYEIFIVIKKTAPPNQNKFSCWIYAEGKTKLSINENRNLSSEDYWYLKDYENEDAIWEKYIAPLFSENKFDVEVKDGQLNLMFYPASVAALMVYPESKAAEVDVKIQKRLLERKKGFSNLPQIPKGFLAWGKEGKKFTIPAGWQEIKSSKENINVSLLTKEDEVRGYVIFQRNYLDLIYPYTTPKKEEVSDKISTFITLGEYEPITFSIYALKNLNNIKLEINDLINQNGNIIKKENIDIRTVGYMPRKISYKTYKLEPTILEKKDSLDIKKETSKRFWITIYVPKETQPGTYTTELNIIPENKNSKKIKMQIEVLPIKLKVPETACGIYYHMDPRWKGFYPQNINKHFTDMKEHGLNSTATYATPKIDMKEEEIRLDFTKAGMFQPWSVDKVMKAHLNAGLTKPILSPGLELMMTYIRDMTGFTIYSPQFDELFKDVARNIKEKEEKENWPELLLYPHDEAANNPKKMKACEYYLKLLKETVPQARTGVTLNGGWGGLDDGRIFDSWLDIRVYNWVTEKVIEDTKKSGDEFWIYNGGSVSSIVLNTIGQSVVDRFFYGFYAARTTAEGVTQWVYQWPSSNINTGPYGELQGIEKKGRHGWYYTYPSEEGPLSTPSWEAIREGIDDAKYIHTLRFLIKKANDSKDPSIKEESNNAENKLVEILQSIDLKFQTRERKKSIKYISENKAIFNKWRRKIAEEILRLQDLLSNK